MANLLMKLAGAVGQASRLPVPRASCAQPHTRLEAASIPIKSGDACPTTETAAEALFTARPAWGGEAAAAVHHFLNTPAGQLFSKRLRAVAAQVAIDGAHDRVNTIHAAGVSAGWNECVRYLHSLSRVSGEQDKAQTGADVRHPFGTNHEQAPEDEAQLLERLSP